MIDDQVLMISIESSGNLCGVTVSKNNSIIANYEIYEPNSHDKLLATQIKRILNDINLSIEDIDALAISSGPGSYTGLRIGASIAKGICYDNKIKFIAVPTLKSLAYAAIELAINQKSCYIISSVKSHKDLVYHQKFDLLANEISEISNTEFDIIKKNIEQNTLYCGFLKCLNSNQEINNYIPDISTKLIANLGYKMYQNSEFCLSENYTPLYVNEFTPQKKE